MQVLDEPVWRAPGTPTGPGVALAGNAGEFLRATAAVWLAVYLIACAVWTYHRCGRCGGTGKRKVAPSGQGVEAVRPL